MTRRYLLKDEVGAALRRGRSVECFLGACGSAGKPGVRLLSMDLADGVFVARLFEMQDLGGPAFLDLYEFAPLDCAVEHGDADQIFSFGSLEECLAFIHQRWPGSSERLVNEGVIQDEYADFVAKRSN